MPDNKYCPKCAMYSVDPFEFREKYGYGSCAGIPHSSGEFPFDFAPHCFTEGPLLTAEEMRKNKIKAIEKIIKKKSLKEAAEYIVDRFDSI